MYQKKSSQISFILPFGGKLSPNNRWIKLANLLPWEEIEEDYAKNFPSRRGAPGKSARMALAALIIKEMLNLSDEDTVEAITETPAMQYFIGLEGFVQEEPFEASSMVHFRKRFPADFVDQINQKLITQAKEAPSKESEDDDDKNTKGASPSVEKKEKTDSENLSEETEEKKEVHQGKLILDATCAPADICYPTDLGLLNKAREKSEKIMDVLYKRSKQTKKKPRSYRRIARKRYLNIARRKKPGSRLIRKGCGQQLRYLSRNLKHIEILATEVSLESLKKRLYKDLLVIHEVFRQQQVMYEEKSHSIVYRIVSISQPHVRPIVRGKAKASVEFGAKLSASVCDQGFVTLDRLNWEAFNESTDLEFQIEKYRERTGHYPKALLADKIYRTRANRKLCKELGIRLSGPGLGRPPKSEDLQKEVRQQNWQDECERNRIEGKFGQAKRRFGLAKIMGKLKGTSESMIAVSFLVLNLVKLRELLFFVLFGVFRLLSALHSKKHSLPDDQQTDSVKYRDTTSDTFVMASC